MKRTFVVFVFLIVVNTLKSFSQSVANLERDPSFKGITIGAPIGKYNDILSFSHTSKGKNVYRVRENRYLSIFNYKMDDMIVVEDDGKVYSIQLTKIYSANAYGAYVFKGQDVLSLYMNLREKYGNNSYSLDDESGTPTVCGMRWKANSVVLDIVYLFYSTFGNEPPKFIYHLYKREDDY